MRNHKLTFRREPRYALLGNKWIDGDRLENIDENYPCKTSCHNHEHQHTGTTTLIYAVCACGWEMLVGDHIYESSAKDEGRHAFILHRIDAVESELVRVSSALMPF